MTDLRSQLQRTLGDAYVLERELGGGGMSRVFVANETRLTRKVVVKVLSPDLAQGISIERFHREIQLAASLQQANIVPVLTAGDTEGLPYYTMPFVEGESLRHTLSGGPLPITQVVSVLRDVARALAYAHSRDVVHRDIKPDNVLLSAGTAVVTDFGIAKALSAARAGGEGETLTQVGTSIGTPAYMAPEQVAGDPDIDFRADLYALGCVGYELLTGNAPFAGRTAQRVLAAHLSEAPRSLADLRADTPPALADLVMRCLAKQPEDRPQSASAIAQQLDGITSGQLDALPGVLRGGPKAFQQALTWYAVTVAAVAILAKAAIVGIGLPSWVFPGAMVVMALGLPLLLFTGYAQRVMHRTVIATPTVTPGGGTRSVVPGGTMATIAVKASPHLSWQRVRLGGLVTLGGFTAFVGLFMALRSLGIGPAGSLLAAGKVERQAPIVVADFLIRNADSSLASVLGGTARSTLGESKVIRVVPTTRMASTLELMQRDPATVIDPALAHEIAIRLGAPAVVEGEATGVGNGFIVTMRLVTTDGGRELASFQESGDGPKGLIDAVGVLTGRLRDRLGESLRDVQRTPPLSQARTASLEALQAYTKAEWANDIEGDWDAAMQYALAAVTIDSSFAEGWRKLAVARQNGGAPQSLVEQAARRAFALRDRLPTNERLMVEASYYGGAGRDRAKEIDTYRQLLARGDSDGALNNLAITLSERREFAESEQLFRLAIARDTTASLSYRNILLPMIGQGAFAAIDSQMGVLRTRYPGGSTDYFLLAALHAKGDLAGVDSAVTVLLAMDDNLGRRIGLRFGVGRAEWRGQLAEARRLGQAYLAAMREAGLATPSPRDSVYGALADAWPRNTPATGVARIDAGLRAVPMASLPVVERPYFEVAAGYARNGRPDKAREILAAYRAEVTDTALRRFDEPDLHRVLGEIALAEGKTAEAIREFRLGEVAPDGPADDCLGCLPIELARAFDRGGQPDSAIAQYETFLATPTFIARFPPWLTPSLMIPFAHYRLGELYEARGNRVKALDHYQSFVDAYRDADAELQPMVTEIRRRMAALGEG